MSTRIEAARPDPESYNQWVFVKGLASMLTATVATACVVSVAAQGTTSPRPFPGAPTPVPSTTPRPSSPPDSPAPAPAPPVQATAPSLAASLGIEMFAGAELLETFDAGSGQKYFIFGSNAAYADVVQFYRTTLKTNGRELYRAPAPAMQQFDLGRFQEDTMAYPPSVVVKDYGGSSAGGYLDVKGTSERRFKTIIQIVPAPPVPSR
jgi:hypothetical protein